MSEETIQKSQQMQQEYERANTELGATALEFSKFRA